MQLRATLVSGLDGRGLPGETVWLSAGHEACSAATDAQGVASCQVTVTDDPGSYASTASFAGDGLLAASTITQALAINPDQSLLTIEAPSANATGATFQLKVRLLSDGGQPLAGRIVTIRGGGSSCVAVTDASGAGSCGLRAGGGLGPTTVTAAFTVDQDFLSSDSSATTIVFGFAQGWTIAGADGDRHGRRQPVMRSGARPRLILILGIGLAAVAVLSFGTASLAGTLLRPPRTGAALAARPEGHLYYPGAIVLGTLLQDEVRNYVIEPNVDASAAASLATPDSKAAVLAWYSAQLALHGWAAAPLHGYIGEADGEWRRGAGESFLLTFDGVMLGNRPAAPPGSTTFTIVYRVRSGY